MSDVDRPAPRDRLELIAVLPTGPRTPLSGTPDRRPGSVRRTTSIDQHRGDLDEPMRVTASGRDLLTRADGTTEVLDTSALRLRVAPTGEVEAIVVEPDPSGAQALVGVHTSSGFRAAASAAVPDHRDRVSVLHQLFDDVPLAALISNYGMTFEHPEWDVPPEATARLTDLCAGWAHEATMLHAHRTTGIYPIPIGPPAPSLTSSHDPAAWHEHGPMAPRSVRRVRRLDLVAGDPLEVDVHFRDSHLGREGVETVLHEYTLRATVDPATRVVRTAVAQAHVLPWPECPGALASAGRVVGHRLADLPRLVRETMAGTSTCTHLNDLLRSLAGLDALLGALDP